MLGVKKEHPNNPIGSALFDPCDAAIAGSIKGTISNQSTPICRVRKVQIVEKRRTPHWFQTVAAKRITPRFASVSRFGDGTVVKANPALTIVKEKYRFRAGVALAGSEFTLLRR